MDNDDALDDKYLLVEKMLQDVRGYAVAPGFNIDIPADRDDLHIDVLF